MKEIEVSQNKKKYPKMWIECDIISSSFRKELCSLVSSSSFHLQQVDSIKTFKDNLCSDVSSSFHLCLSFLSLSAEKES